MGIKGKVDKVNLKKMAEEKRLEAERQAKMAKCSRKRMEEIFDEGYESIANDIIDYFGGKEEIEKEGVTANANMIKKLMITGIKNIHNQILLEDAENKLEETKRKEVNK